MRHDGGDPELLGHFTVLIYPFRHQLVGAARQARLGSLEPRWAAWASRFSEADLAVKLETTGFFFPYIRGLLYPEVVWLQERTPGEDHAHWASLLRKAADEGLTALGRELPPGVLRLTLRPGAHALLEEFTVHCPVGHGHDSLDLPACCDWVDAQLFPSGIGFLLLKVRLAGPGARLSGLIRLNQALRQVLPLSRYTRMARFHLAGEGPLDLRDLMNDLTGGLTHPAGRPYTDSEAGRTYGERCHLVSHACVDLEGLTPAELPAGPFPDGADRLVFELAACIGLGESVHNPTWVPSADQAARFCRNNRLALWRCWTGMVLKDALVFLGTQDISFNRRSLPRQVENEYLPLYLFALYQKLQLFTFSNELLHEVAQSCGHLRGARALLQRFVAFRSQYWFAEVTHKPQGGDLYRSFQRGLEAPLLYEMVTSSVKDVKEYYESVWARQMQMLKDAVTFGGPLTVGLGALRMAVDPGQHGWTLLGVLAGLFVLVLVAVLRWCRLRPARRGKRRRLAVTGPARPWQASSPPASEPLRRAA